jgi:hypothetical protein
VISLRPRQQPPPTIPASALLIGTTVRPLHAPCLRCSTGSAASSSRNPIPWRAAYRGACPAPIDGNHMHGIQGTLTREVREICSLFTTSPIGTKWTMLNLEPVQAYSTVLVSPGKVEFYIPGGVGVMPGWPFSSTPEPCSAPQCLQK